MAEWAIALASSADTAQRVRYALAGLFPDIGSLKVRSGMLSSGGGVTLTSGMGVSVGAFRCYIQGVSGTAQSGYFAMLDVSKTLTFADGGASNRTDLIVARMYDNTYDASGQTKFAVEIFPGTPGAGTPTPPDNSIVLAEKIITAGMSAGTGGLGTAPTDKRPPMLVARGGLVPVVDATDRATLSRHTGLAVYRLDTSVIEVCTSASGNTWATINPSDSSWSNISLHTGFTAQAGATPKKRTLRGNEVKLKGRVNGTFGVSADVTIADAGAVPSPPEQVEKQISTNSADKTCRAFITTDGAIHVITGPSAPSYVYLDGLSGYMLD